MLRAVEGTAKVTSVAILSALYGPYEWPKPVPPDLGVPALMMTDDPDLEAPGWTTCVVTDHLVKLDGYRGELPWTDPAATVDMMRHKFWKCHPHMAFRHAGIPDPDVIIWLDASMTITAESFVDKCLAALGDDDWSVTPHPWRGCIYDEASFSAHLPRYHLLSLALQADFYRSFHPPSWGLFATGASTRRMTPLVKEIGEQWWHECCRWTHQDQVSLPVLFRLYEEKGLKWNASMPWWQWWHLGEHGR